MVVDTPVLPAFEDTLMRISSHHHVHRGETTPFRHGFRVENLGLPDDGMPGELVLMMDVLDPVGAPTSMAGSPRTITFEDPSLGITLMRILPEDGDTPARKRPVFMPRALIEALEREAADLGAQVTVRLEAKGASADAARRVGMGVASALQGAIFRPDHFGVEGWSPYLSGPFALVLSGPWKGTPPEADPIPQPATSDA